MSVADRLASVLDASHPRLTALSDVEASDKLPGHWSKKEILGHLIDSASNNHQRFVRSLLQPRIDFPGYEQDAWVATQRYASEPWDSLVQLWVHLNRHLVHIMHAIPVAAREHILSIGGKEPVTLGFVMEGYLSHLEHHLDQILS